MSYLKAVAGVLDDKGHGPCVQVAAQLTQQPYAQLLRMARHRADLDLAQAQARFEVGDGLADFPGQLTPVIAALLLQRGPVGDAVVQDARRFGQRPWAASGIEQA